MALRNISGSSGHVQVMNLWKKNNKKKRDREERSLHIHFSSCSPSLMRLCAQLGLCSINSTCSPQQPFLSVRFSSFFYPEEEAGGGRRRGMLSCWVWVLSTGREGQWGELRIPNPTVRVNLHSLLTTLMLLGQTEGCRCESFSVLFHIHNGLNIVRRMGLAGTAPDGHSG